MSIDDAVKQVEHLSVKWSKKYPALGKYIVKMEWNPYLTFLNHHIKIRRMMYTANQKERFYKSAGRNLKIRGAFPDEESVFPLITDTAIDKGEKAYKYAIHNFKLETSLGTDTLIWKVSICRVHILSNNCKKALGNTPKAVNI